MLQAEANMDYLLAVDNASTGSEYGLPLPPVMAAVGSEHGQPLSLVKAAAGNRNHIRSECDWK